MLNRRRVHSSSPRRRVQRSPLGRPRSVRRAARPAAGTRRRRAPSLSAVLSLLSVIAVIVVAVWNGPALVRTFSNAALHLEQVEQATAEDGSGGLEGGTQPATSTEPEPAREISADLLEVDHQFDFAGRPVRVRFTISRADYQSSVSRPGSMELNGETHAEWVRKYYRRWLQWEEQSRALDAALVALRVIRQDLALDNAQYAELLAAYVQTRPYDYVKFRTGEGVKRYPATMLVEGIGTCEEKSMLLGGLLAKEGYHACLILLEDDNHMAVGIRSDAMSYKGEPYAFIDAVGVTRYTVEEAAQQPVPIGQSFDYVSEPLVITLVNDGTRYEPR